MSHHSHIELVSDGGLKMNELHRNLILGVMGFVVPNFWIHMLYRWTNRRRQDPTIGFLSAIAWVIAGGWLTCVIMFEAMDRSVINAYAPFSEGYWLPQLGQILCIFGLIAQVSFFMGRLHAPLPPLDTTEPKQQAPSGSEDTT